VTRHLLVIGAQRCGTTYLATLLDEHPEIAMARPARPEPKVFLSPQVLERGRQWYVDTYFAHAAGSSVLAEKSTSYLEDGTAADRAARVLGEAAIVVQLRDPVIRAVSNWRFSTAHGLEDLPLAEALERSLQGGREWDRTKTSVSPFAYLERGRYADYLEPWLSRFPDSVHVRFLEDVVARRTSAADLYRVVGVDATFEAPTEDVRVHESGGTEPKLDDDLLVRLRDYFADSDARLAERLHRNVPWQPRAAGGHRSAGHREIQ
jgi:Sulfotransferase domain